MKITPVGGRLAVPSFLPALARVGQALPLHFFKVGAQAGEQEKSQKTIFSRSPKLRGVASAVPENRLAKLIKLRWLVRFEP